MFDVGATLGNRYVLETLVARGGMGEVWSARDIVLDRRVAVKVLLPNLAGDPDFTARFRAEARAMAALSHPGIVEIYDYGQADGLAYLVMQFVEGESLVALIRRSGPLAPDRAMRLVIQAAEAIEAAHRQGIVHRDVKPANLMLRKDGRLALTDFGIARILAADRITGADQIVGTAYYLAPEQVTGAEVGPATDVYALGVVAYELLAGVRPFVADTPFEVSLKHVYEEPPPLPDSVPGPVRELVVRALAKDPAQRWPSAAALARAAAATIGRLPATIVTPAAAEVPAESEGSTPSTPSTPSTTGEITRTTHRGATAFEEPAGRAVPARKRLLLAGGTAVSMAVAAVVAIVILSPDGSGTPQSQRPGTFPSSVVMASGDPGRTDATATPTAGMPAGTATTTRPANPNPNPTATGPGQQAGNPSTPSTTATTATTARVPVMYGWKENEVKAEMARLGLLQRIRYEWTPDKCYVIEQTPSGGTMVPIGSTVDVTIARATGQCLEV